MSFEDWKSDFLSRAKDHVDPAIVDECAPFLELQKALVTADATQPEARKSLRQYLDVTASDTRVRSGQQKLADHVDTFDVIEDRFKVPREIVAAIWGMETKYGAIRGDVSVFAALATMAFEGRRRAMFEGQLVAAMQIAADGCSPAKKMIGSWAGAMGHTQFMPTSYRDYAIGLTSDVANIWDDDPTDALASAANYLAQHGWVTDDRWAIQVSWPRNLDLFVARHHDPQPLQNWSSLGVCATRSEKSNAAWSFHLPAGHNGPAFLIGENYRALLAYNNADAYAIGVGHLADRLAGKPEFAVWQSDARGLTRAEVQMCQQRLTVLGFDTYGADGFTGPNTNRAVEAFQKERGLVVDGFLGLDMFSALTD